mmetsp:Transcript_136661/g.340800  ORF Transcript_136661/g.340800 Transcript_136661/m.340800 type:complete len:290 (+) Transcript_136661:703-1572(+)
MQVAYRLEQRHAKLMRRGLRQVAAVRPRDGRRQLHAVEVVQDEHGSVHQSHALDGLDDVRVPDGAQDFVLALHYADHLLIHRADNLQGYLSTILATSGAVNNCNRPLAHDLGDAVPLRQLLQVQAAAVRDACRGECLLLGARCVQSQRCVLAPSEQAGRPPRQLEPGAALRGRDAVGGRFRSGGRGVLRLEPRRGLAEAPACRLLLLLLLRRRWLLPTLAAPSMDLHAEVVDADSVALDSWGRQVLLRSGLHSRPEPAGARLRRASALPGGQRCGGRGHRRLAAAGHGR